MPHVRVAPGVGHDVAIRLACRSAVAMPQNSYRVMVQLGTRTLLPRLALVGNARVGRCGRTGYDPIGLAAGIDADDWVQVRDQRAVEFGASDAGPTPGKVLRTLRQPSLRSPGPPSGRICRTYPRSIARSPEGERGSG